MTEFTRIQWASEPAKSVWQPRVSAIDRAWKQVEVDSVREGLRDAALVFDAQHLDLHTLRCETVASNRSVIVREGEGAVASEFVRAWQERDDKIVGALLGFPDCCAAFFDRLWNVEGKRDTTLLMAGVQQNDNTVLHLHGPIECNILGRWIGVRLVPHLPCSFDCAKTFQLARRLCVLWPEQELAWAEEFLNWPAEYSALHGIATITTPVVRVTTSTDYTPTVQIVRFMGAAYPVDAPKGSRYPFTERT